MKRQLLAVLVILVVGLAGASLYLILLSTSSPPHAATPVSTDCRSSTASPSGSPPVGNLTAGNWTTYHGNDSRSGFQSAGSIKSVQPRWVGPTGLDGQVYAEPLLCGDSVFVVTEQNSVYAINATTGNVAWRTNLGNPVPGSSLPCGDINPTGITGTPVIDVATKTLFVVAFLNPVHHVLFGLSIRNGSVTSQLLVDPVGADPHVEQERGALALVKGVVYIPYGGLDGDCGAYHGWIVGAKTDGSGGLLSYEVPTGRAGGIWSAAGISVGGNGNLYVATGNSDATATFDYGDSVIELSPALQLLSYFAPTNWAQLNSGDTDVGSVAPMILPDGDVFQIGKEGVGYVLSGTNLGGIGGQIAAGNICSGAYGGTARVGQSVLIPCLDGLVKLVVGPSTFSVTWQTASFATGSPIVTGDIVWVTNTSTGDLLGFNFSTGQEVFSFSLGTVDHFVTPAASPGRLFVAAGTQLFSFALR
ncbi:MAG: PQQ-binding-like beta-propeller repeat protein [Thermoplasmata archaeon]|nr:PQQ-binding-like beta-propeller repeat protein [Thermoplasmata archaeon]